ncbi:hypothetical protein [Flavobacterium sp.]|jgi:hypothetical protein|uniref:hypothetical protein n=1 Tax=Flavobacterium sp. TaxID=239 RepID=UPI0037BF7F65
MKNKNRNLLVIAILSSLAILLMTYKCENKVNNKTDKLIDKPTTENANSKPIEGLDIPYQHFEVDAEKVNTLTTNEGTQIRIPKNAFLDEDGQPVIGKVKIEYREFRNPLDFYIAGIPMELENNGEKKVFVSGGMFEMNAITENNKNASVNPKNLIKVDLLSTSKSTDFNVYDLDKKTNTWVLKGKDSINVKNKEKELTALSIPPVPQIAKPYSFSIKDDTGEYPEIKEYENVKFTPINLNTCAISNAQEMKVIPREHGIYEVVSITKLGKYRNERSCLCYLAFDEGKDYNEALRKYQKKYGPLIQKKNDILKMWDKYELDLAKVAILKSNLNEKITRTLEVNQFGFVNIDYESSFPIGVELKPNFVDADGKKLELKNVALIEKETNAIYRYTNKIKFNPKKTNILIGITADNKLAFIKSKDLNKLSNNSASIQMYIYENKLVSYDDIFKFIFKN